MRLALTLPLSGRKIDCECFDVTEKGLKTLLILDPYAIFFIALYSSGICFSDIF